MNKYLKKEINNFKWNDHCDQYEKLPDVIACVPRIIAIGDIHGDIQLLKDCLKIAKVINENNEWVGEKTYVVQIGDQLDRCRNPGMCQYENITEDDEDDIDVLYYLTELNEKAKKVWRNGYKFIRKSRINEC